MQKKMFLFDSENENNKVDYKDNNNEIFFQSKKTK